MQLFEGADEKTACFTRYDYFCKRMLGACPSSFRPAPGRQTTSPVWDARRFRNLEVQGLEPVPHRFLCFLLCNAASLVHLLHQVIPPRFDLITLHNGISPGFQLIRGTLGIGRLLRNADGPHLQDAAVVQAG
jgi:hypothetical protein